MRRRLALVLAVALALVATTVAPITAQGHGSRHFPARIDLPDGWNPEGITAGRGTIVYVGSLANGAIRKVDVKTGRQRTLVAGPGAPAVGVEFDRRNNRLWVAGGPSGEVRVYNATTGRHLRTYTFPGSGFLNDLVVTPHAVYITDSGFAHLKVVPLGPGGRLKAQSATRILPLSGDYAHVPDEFNLNGIVSRGGWLIAVQSITGTLFRINPRTGSARAIDLGGEVVTFGDGLELNGGTLYVVRNQQNRVAVVRLSWNLLKGRLARHITAPAGALSVPTTVALQAGRLWAVNARFGVMPAPTTFWITRLPAHR